LEANARRGALTEKSVAALLCKGKLKIPINAIAKITEGLTTTELQACTELLDCRSVKVMQVSERAVNYSAGTPEELTEKVTNLGSARNN
jgi:hypothetical protein